jgi:diadenosine tetraphosphate (Ap4A) HIT family hydrolase
VPIAHRTSVFDLTPAEWADAQVLLLQARIALHDLLAPDGYLLGWNQGGVLHPQTSRSMGARERTGTSGLSVICH